MAWTKEKAREYAREHKKWLAEHHFCIMCGKNKAVPGKKHCYECCEKARKKKKNRSKETRERYNAAAKKKYYELKEQGICVQCRKHPTNGTALCAYCLGITRAKHKEYRLEKGILPRCLMGDGHSCYNCGKESLPGKKVCKDCYDKLCANLVKARAALDGKPHKWSSFKFGKKVEQ